MLCTPLQAATEVKRITLLRYKLYVTMLPIYTLFGMEDWKYGMECGRKFNMEWKKTAGMEHGKIIFLSIPNHALLVQTLHSLLPKIIIQNGLEL